MSEEIHEVVRERYGRIAAESAACCGDGGCGVTLYDESLLEALPAEVTGLSLGCGDPVSIAGLRPGEVVLDLGSGGGIDCFLAAQQVGATGRVIGVDMTPEMLERAEAARRRMGLTQVEFRAGRIEALPLEDCSVDVILSNCVINLAPDKAPVFREALRVLRPGGRIAISDIVTLGDFSPALRADAQKWAECVTGALPAEEYSGLMRAAGFASIRVVDKADAGEIIPAAPGMPRILSARITALRPE